MGNELSRQVTTVQLWENIHAAGLATPDECRRWSRAVAEAIGKNSVGDLNQLTAALVKFGFLTPYQANVLARELPHPLMLDGVRIQRSLDKELGPYWYEGGKEAPASQSVGQRLPPLETGTTQNDSRWFVAISSQAVASLPLLDWLPSLTWAERQCEAQSQYLDDWIGAGATLKFLYASVSPCVYPSLAVQLENGTFRPEKTDRLVHEIANGLLAMHTLGLVHGRIHPKIIMGDDASGYMLRRDPFFPPRSPYQGIVPSVFQEWEEPYATAAPELVHPNAVPTVRSDLYALGCIWYRCLTGEWPFQPGSDAPPAKWALLHAQVPLQMPSKLTELRSKCLMHLLAKDPRTRFPSVQAFLQAFEQASKEPYPVAETMTESVAEPPAPYVAVKPTNANASASVRKKTSTKDEKVQSTEPLADANRASSEESKAEKLAAEMRDKKSKLALRYHARPFGTAVPGKIPSLNAPAVQSSAPMAPAPAVPSTTPNGETGAAETPLKTAPQPRSLSPASPREATEGTATPVSKSTGASPATSTTTESRQSSDPTGVGNASREVSVKQSVAPKLADGNARESGRKSVAKGRTKGPSQGPSKGRRKPKRPVWFMPAMIAGSCILLAVLLYALRGTSRGIVTIENQPNRRSTSEVRSPAESNPVTAPVAVQPAIDPMTEYFDVKPDDGKLPWAPPSVGSPYSLELFPMGPEMLVFVSERAWGSAGPVPAVAKWWQTLNPEDGVPLPETQWLKSTDRVSVGVAWYPGKEPSTSQRVVRFTFPEAKKLSDLVQGLETWKTKTGKANADGFRCTLWERPDVDDGLAMVAESFASTSDALVKRVTIGPSELLETMSETQGGTGPLRRQMDILLSTTDRLADITVLTAPSFLYGDGKDILGSHAPHVLGMLRSVVGDSVQALLIRTHLEPQWYLEWRTLGNDLQAATRNASELKGRLESLPDAIESALVAQPADPYWRAIANRYPQMLRSAMRYARAGAEDGQVVVNAYLPSDALLNMAIGTWMVSQRDVSAATPSAKPTAKPPAAPKSMEQWLDSTLSLRIEQDSLENVLQSIASELKDSSGQSSDPIPMAINGTAFQKDGITRNQQIRGFEYKDIPLRKVLTDLARKANPVTTVQSPNERDQKVVWVVLDDPTSLTKKKIELTTRAWTDSNQVALPSEFIVPKE